jgi:hypothetical protein
VNFYGVAKDLKPITVGYYQTGVWYHVFDSREGRDAWVQNKAEAAEYGETREVLSSKDTLLRSYLRDEREGWESLSYHYKDDEEQS